MHNNYQRIKNLESMRKRKTQKFYSEYNPTPTMRDRFQQDIKAIDRQIKKLKSEIKKK